VNGAAAADTGHGPFHCGWCLSGGLESDYGKPVWSAVIMVSGKHADGTEKTEDELVDEICEAHQTRSTMHQPLVQ
jgi:hypothetical protein